MFSCNKKSDVDADVTLAIISLVGNVIRSIGIDQEHLRTLLAVMDTEDEIPNYAAAILTSLTRAIEGVTSEGSGIL